MSSEVEQSAYPPTEGAAPLASVSDVEMVVASDSSGAKTTRNVQTQHGDYRSVDEENIFLIARCLWPEDEKKPYKPFASTSSEDNVEGSGSKASEEEEPEQVVWIEPFENEVRFYCKYLPLQPNINSK